ncbi:hypothetical protein O7621_14655 [Solwaraspora sp. WMMD937]|uniref:hypothetical protein n=1 Tax=Solwaraspora sp. WMMD937 TaxID=3016090 RepID=UPI00249C1E8D|nr:hypothetical protein [Solwaraspora sp. WMMD937]WFE19209.1 hypothetical protein O7621_14655 [Solwaraspora sp. WMMD937]
MIGYGSIDRLQHVTVVASHSRVNTGIWVVNGWFKTLDNSISNEELAGAVLEAFAKTRDGVGQEFVEGVKGRMRQIFNSVEVDSYAAYLEGLVSVNARREFPASSVELTPMQNLGPRRGLRFDLDQMVVVSPDAGLNDLGASIRVALDRAS